MVTTTWAEGEVDAGTVTVQAFWPGQLVGATRPLNVATMCPSVLEKFAPEIVMLWPAEPLEGLNDEITGGPLGVDGDRRWRWRSSTRMKGWSRPFRRDQAGSGVGRRRAGRCRGRGGRTGGARGRRGSWTGDQRDQQGDCRRADQGGDHGDGAGQPAIAPRRGRTRGRRTREGRRATGFLVRSARLGGGHLASWSAWGQEVSVDTCRIRRAARTALSHRPQGALSRRPGRRFGRRMLVCHRPVPVPRTIGSTAALA